MKQKFSKEYFNEEVVRFFDFCGKKEFWNLSEEKREAALQGLFHVYLNTDSDTETLSSTMNVALINYEERKKLMCNFF